MKMLLGILIIFTLIMAGCLKCELLINVIQIYFIPRVHYSQCADKLRIIMFEKLRILIRDTKVQFQEKGFKRDNLTNRMSAKNPTHGF